jgi:hypothetical protein
MRPQGKAVNPEVSNFIEKTAENTDPIPVRCSSQFMALESS